MQQTATHTYTHDNPCGHIDYTDNYSSDLI